ncbi:hypothetical protein QYM36_000491 [Artemia franciscana]|uniref:Integrase catalytic domain-containing protein n=1 Tax=Artemia franciscana TaxID=6661 RepID=A0AA88ISM9_ARTSF|nr:hypothetical protein QYM36_000491 [Artemia franciscana]
MSSISTNALSAAFGYDQKTKPKTEDEYFKSDVEDKPTYQLAPGSPGINVKAKYEMQVAKEGGGKKTKRDLKGILDDIEMEDAKESYYKYMAENPTLSSADDTSDTEIEYDAEGNPIIPTKSKHIDPLPRIDHSKVEYLPFEEIFISNQTSLTSAEFTEIMRKNGIQLLHSPPYHPNSNGVAERAVRTCHSVTGISPARLFLERELRNRLDLLEPTSVTDHKEKSKPTVGPQKYNVGDAVLVRDYENPDRPVWVQGVILKCVTSIIFL